MITILITAAANAAIRDSLPKGAKASPAGHGEGGGFCLTLDLETIDRLTALRRPGESYSDVILRLAAAGEALALKPPPQRRVTAQRRAFHHDEAGALQVSDQPFGDDVHHECVRVVLALAPLKFQREGERCG
jgi:hypothetical protein